MEAQVRKRKNKKKKVVNEKIQRYSWIIEELLQVNQLTLDEIIELYKSNDPSVMNKKEKAFYNLYKRDLEDLEYMKLLVSEKTKSFKLNPKKDKEWNTIRESADIYMATYRIIGMHILIYEFGLPIKALRNTKIDDIPFGKTITLFSIDRIENIPQIQKDDLKEDILTYLNIHQNVKSDEYTYAEIAKDLKPIESKINEKLEMINLIPYNNNKKWNKDDEYKLLECIEKLSNELGRTQGAVLNRIKKFSYNGFEDDDTRDYYGNIIDESKDNEKSISEKESEGKTSVFDI